MQVAVFTNGRKTDVRSHCYEGQFPGAVLNVDFPSDSLSIHVGSVDELRTLSDAIAKAVTQLEAVPVTPETAAEVLAMQASSL